MNQELIKKVSDLKSFFSDIHTELMSEKTRKFDIDKLTDKNKAMVQELKDLKKHIRIQKTLIGYYESKTTPYIVCNTCDGIGWFGGGDEYGNCHGEVCLHCDGNGILPAIQEGKQQVPENSSNQSSNDNDFIF